MLYLLLLLPRNEQFDKKNDFIYSFFLLKFIIFYIIYLLFIINNIIVASGPFATQTAGTLSGSQRLKRAGALYLLAMPAVRLPLVKSRSRGRRLPHTSEKVKKYG